jgi:hypothetical protein
MGKNMKISNVGIIAMFVLLPGCATDVINYPNELIGVWGNSDDNGKTIWGYDEYFPDGTIKSWGTLPDDNYHYESEGKYELVGSNPILSCITVTKTSDPRIMSLGDYWCDELVKITEDKLIFKDEEGFQFTLYKQKDNVDLNNDINTVISCKSEFFSSPTKTVLFDIKIIKDADNRLKSIINGKLTNKDVKVNEFNIRQNLDLHIDSIEAIKRNYNDGESSLLHIEKLSTDRQLSLGLQIPFDTEEVRKVLIYSLQENDETKIYGGTNLIEAYDSEGRFLGRVFRSLLLNGCF